MRAQALSAGCAIASLLAALGCGEPPAQIERFAAVLRATSPSGEPVAGVHAWGDGRALGATDELGTLRAELPGREGRELELTAACPAAYRTEPASRRLVLRRVQRAPNARAGAMELVVRCVPIEHSAAIVVLASGRGLGSLPVRVGGEIIGQTDADGTAHLLVQAPADAPLRVELDTSAHPRLQPRNPVHSFRLEDEESIVLVEQRFVIPPRVQPRRRQLPMPTPQRPARID